MTFKSFDSRIVIRILAGIALLVLLFVAADWLIPASKAKKYRYDKKGRLTSLTTLNGRDIKYGYDKAGLLTGVSYHKRGGITNISYPASDSVSYEYDAAGNRIGMKDRLGKTRYAYDDLNRPSEVISSDNKKLSYQYDPWNQVKAISFPDGITVQYRHDLTGNIVRLTDAAGTVGYEYRGDANQVVRRLPNGISTTYKYSESGQLESITHLDRNNQLMCSYGYKRDSDGRIIKIEETTPSGTATSGYEYDSLGRLSKVTHPDNASETYQYDSVGNRTSETNSSGTTNYQYDAQGRLTKAGDTQFAYDYVGNLVSRKEKGDTTTYVYDDENRLLEVKSNKNKVRYSYDGDGNRVQREFNGKVTHYLNETVMGKPQVIAEYGKDNKLARYLLGQTRVGSSNKSGETVYFLEDHLGSTRYVVDAAGVTVARYSYSTFGGPKVVEGQSENASLYTGELWDADTGLLYLRARYYDPLLGRFLSPDPNPGSPISPASFNQFAYASNDPINHVDPLGLQTSFPTPVIPPRPIPQPSPVQPARGFTWQELNRGTYFGTGLGETAAMHWAQRLEQTGNRLYYIPGLLSALWTPETWKDTTLTLGPEVAFRGIGLATRQFSKNAYDAARAAGVAGREPVHVKLADRYVHYGIDKSQHIGITLPEWGNKLVGYPLRGGVPKPASGASFIHLRETHLNIGGQGFRPLGFESTFRGVDLTWPEVGVILGGGRQLLRDHLQDSQREVTVEPPSPFSTDTKTNIFLPPPGGGGSSAPAVGGVYLDQAVQVMGQLASITGATFDSSTGQLILIGEKNTALPAVKPQYLAEAIRVIYSDRTHEPGMTIDPASNDPHGPIMNVVFFGNTENTRLGSVMFEADRVMKGYSVGSDNITKRPIESNIPGYLSTAAIDLRDGNQNTGLWSRFWLVPEPVTAKTSADGRTIMFDPIKMRVKTETMRWEGGKLVSAGGIKDVAAEVFATHFSKQYDDFARENSIYAELTQVTQAVAIAKWMKQQNIPVDWNFVRLYGSQPYNTPTTTPSANSEISQGYTEGNRVGTRTITTIGGVEMVPHLQAQNVPEADAVHTQVTQQSATAQQQGQLSFRIKWDQKEFDGIALPGTNEREVAGYEITESEPNDCLNVPPEMANLPGLARFYNSSHNEATEFGFSWSLLTPRLQFETVEENGQSHYLSVENEPTTRVLVQRFLLTNQFGLGEEKFTETSIDEGLRRIVFKPEKASDKFRGLYPESDGTYRIILHSGEQVLFDAKGTLKAILRNDYQVLYDYDTANRLNAVRLINATQENRVIFANDGMGRIVSASFANNRADYQYDAAGNLGSAKCSSRTFEYGYNGTRLLSDVKLNGDIIVKNNYDALGRLLNQEDQYGNQLEQKVELIGNERVVTTISGVNVNKKHYDSSRRLIAQENGTGSTVAYSYDDAGRISNIGQKLPTGGNSKVEISADRRTVTTHDPRNVRSEYLFNERNQVIEISVNGNREASYRYDDLGRLVTVSYADGSSEALNYDPQGRLLDYRRQYGGDDTNAAPEITVTYNEQGEITSLGNSSGGTTSLSQDDSILTVTRDNASPLRYEYDGERLIRINGGPQESIVNYVYRSNGDFGGVEISNAGGRRRLEITDSSVINTDWNGQQVVYSYDAQHLLTSVRDTSGAQTLYSYDGKKRLSRIELPNGRCLNYSYYSSSGLIREERWNACRR